jgi:uncharacterized protein with FMN-binding domain
MHKAAPVVAASAALIVPIGNAVAATRAATASVPTTLKNKVVVITRTVSGSPGSAGQWGNVQVTLVVRKTTTTVGLKTRIARKITKVRVPVSPNHTDRSIYINQQALPLLEQETLQLQFQLSKFQLVSGATDSSYGFANSLQSALLRAKKV